MSEWAPLADTLADANQDDANDLFIAFQDASRGMNIATVWWGFAMVQAHLLAIAPEEIRIEVATRLAELCRVALPAALMNAQPHVNGVSDAS